MNGKQKLKRRYRGKTKLGLLLKVWRPAFYYPWYPEDWNQNGIDPHTRFKPTREIAYEEVI